MHEPLIKGLEGPSLRMSLAQEFEGHSPNGWEGTEDWDAMQAHSCQAQEVILFTQKMLTARSSSQARGTGHSVSFFFIT
jgi:hypothetical protein